MTLKRHFLLICIIAAIHTTSAQGQEAETPQLDQPVVPQNKVETRTPSEVIFDTVKQKAMRAAGEEFNAPSYDLPKVLSELNYNQYRAIRYNPDKAIWRDKANFEIQAFHPGFIFTSSVKVNTVSAEGSIISQPYQTDNFIFDEAADFLREKQFGNVGFSGFRIHYPLNSGDYKDELLAFQGASYFRLLSSGQTFGLSARGVAIDTAEATGEEFPFFSEFWLLVPKAGDTRMHIFALLDSPSLTGAYRFELIPGLPSELHIDFSLYARKDVGKLGIAPLTSMFLYGENSVRRADDMRPEIHDSDGLIMQTSTDEWIWRALSNPTELRIVGLSDRNPKGFGLLQRDSDFDHYQDIGATYQTRPGLWVSPVGEWGPGHVELVEIPSPSETNDNIVAYWVPSAKLKKGESFSASYVLSSVGSEFGPERLARVTRTGNSWIELPGSRAKISRSVRRFSVDFSAAAIDQLHESTPITADISSSRGDIKEVNVNKIPGDKGWRVSFVLDNTDQRSADMRLYLSLRGERISEVWNYVWSPKSLE